MTVFCKCGLAMVKIADKYYCPKHGKESKDYKEPRGTIGKYSGFSTRVKGKYEIA